MDLLERPEVADAVCHPGGSTKPKSERKNGNTDNADGREKSMKGKCSGKHCVIHNNDLHDTSECRLLSEFVRDHKKPEAGHAPKGKSAECFSKHTRKEDKPRHVPTKHSKQEINQIASAVKTVLASNCTKNKRKRDDADSVATPRVSDKASDISSDSDSPEERFEMDLSKLDLTEE